MPSRRGLRSRSSTGPVPCGPAGPRGRRARLAAQRSPQAAGGQGVPGLASRSRVPRPPPGPAAPPAGRRPRPCAGPRGAGEEGSVAAPNRGGIGCAYLKQGPELAHREIAAGGQAGAGHGGRAGREAGRLPPRGLAGLDPPSAPAPIANCAPPGRRPYPMAAHPSSSGRRADSRPGEGHSSGWRDRIVRQEGSDPEYDVRRRAWGAGGGAASTGGTKRRAPTARGRWRSRFAARTGGRSGAVTAKSCSGDTVRCWSRSPGIAEPRRLARRR